MLIGVTILVIIMITGVALYSYALYNRSENVCPICRSDKDVTLVKAYDQDRKVYTCFKDQIVFFSYTNPNKVLFKFYTYINDPEQKMYNITFN